MKKSYLKIMKLMFAIILTIAIILSITYYYQDANAKEKYFQKYDECNAKAKENPIRSVGGVKNTNELKFVVSCFENKGCYEPCINSSEPSYPGVNFTDLFKFSSSNLDICEKRCYYSKDYFN